MAASPKLRPPPRFAPFTWRASKQAMPARFSMTPDAIFAIIQIALAAITAVLYGLECKRHKPAAGGGARSAEWRLWMVWLVISGVSLGMITWRLGTVSSIVSPEYRATGGMSVQTLYQLVVLAAYTALRYHSDSKK